MLFQLMFKENIATLWEYETGHLVFLFCHFYPINWLKETSVVLGFWDALSLRLQKIKAKKFLPDSTFY